MDPSSSRRTKAAAMEEARELLSHWGQAVTAAGLGAEASPGGLQTNIELRAAPAGGQTRSLWAFIQAQLDTSKAGDGTASETDSAPCGGVEVLVSYHGAKTHPWLHAVCFPSGCSHCLGRLRRLINVPGHSQVLPESFTPLKAPQNQPSSDFSGVTGLIYPSAQTRRGYCSQQQEQGSSTRHLGISSTSSSSGALSLCTLSPARGQKSPACSLPRVF